MTKTNISALKRSIAQIEQEGYITDCWIARYRPGGTARGEESYFQLRSRNPFTDGTRTKHLSAGELPAYQKLVENGRLLKKLKRQLARVEQQDVTTHNVLTSSASDEWYTPPSILVLARQVLGSIDLDPASNAIAQQWIQAESYYSIQDDGLNREWHGRVWLNPPYGTQVRLWTEKIVCEYQQGNVTAALLLVRPAVGSSWYQTLAQVHPRCEPHKRIRFIDAKGNQQSSPVHGNVFFYLGEEMKCFFEVFSTIGTVSVPYKSG